MRMYRSIIARFGFIVLFLVMASLAFGCGGKSNVATSETETPTGAPTPPVQTQKALPASEPKVDPNLEAKKRDDVAREKLEEERKRIEAQKQQAEAALRDAIVIQAPSLGKGGPKDPTKSNYDDFASRMRDLSGNEFKFRESKGAVFRSTFNQSDQNYTASIKYYFARNAIVSPGKYDFDKGEYAIELVFWQSLYEEMKFGDGPVSPRVDDSGKLLATIKVDPKTAQKWREALDKGTFSLTIWYRLTKIEKAEWKQNPRTKASELYHDISLVIDVIKFE